MVVSKTQSGKTGSMCATIKQYLEDTSNLIPIENIYIITGIVNIFFIIKQEMMVYISLIFAKYTHMTEAWIIRSCKQKS